MKKRLLTIFITIIILLLVGCGNKTSDLESSNDYSTYAGAWISDEASMDITYNNNDIINLSFFLPNHDGSRIASIDLSVLIASIVNNSVTMAFEDSWGTSGTAILTFDKDSITFEIKNITSSGDMWGVYEGVFEFSRDDSQNEEEEYEEYYQPAPVYDTSKASGILASLGMTEEEFRAQCIPLHFNTPNEFFIEAGKQYVQQHPELDKTEELIYKWDNDLLYVPNKEAQYGSKQGYIDSYFKKIGYEQYEKPSGDLVKNMFLYPTDYKGKYFVIPNMYAEYKGVSSDNYIYYKDDEMYIDSSNSSWGDKYKVIIFDYRDDTNYPTLSEKDNFDAYVIFDGVDASDTLRFCLISSDRVNN